MAANCTSIVLHTFQKIEDYRNKLGAINMYLRRNRVSRQLAKLVRHEKRAFALVNEGRTQRGLPPLK